MKFQGWCLIGRVIYATWRWRFDQLISWMRIIGVREGRKADRISPPHRLDLGEALIGLCLNLSTKGPRLR